MDPAAALCWHSEGADLPPSPLVVGPWVCSGRRSAEVFVGEYAVDRGAWGSVASDEFTLVELMHPHPYGRGTSLAPDLRRMVLKGRIFDSRGGTRCSRS